ncbi:hypothetical protein H632_c601p0, partial [Helicosporidium sp. ATCC 50920]
MSTISETALEYQVVSCSSEDSGHGAARLSQQEHHGPGWSSAPQCAYPQDVTLALRHPSRLTSLQLLSHEARVAAKVEIQVAQAAGAAWERLGYFAFDSNERSGFRAREMKRVSLPARTEPVQAVRLVFHRCHANAQNPDRQ